MEHGPCIGDLPIQIVIFHNYVKLPEGTSIVVAEDSFQPTKRLKKASGQFQQGVWTWLTQPSAFEHGDDKSTIYIHLPSGKLT